MKRDELPFSQRKFNFIYEKIVICAEEFHFHNISVYKISQSKFYILAFSENHLRNFKVKENHH